VIRDHLLAGSFTSLNDDRLSCQVSFIIPKDAPHCKMCVGRCMPDVLVDVTVNGAASTVDIMQVPMTLQDEESCI
jgi:hypothetical protein